MHSLRETDGMVIAASTLTLRFFFALTGSLGINGIWFGILEVKLAGTAVITLHGLNVYVVKGLASSTQGWLRAGWLETKISS